MIQNISLAGYGEERIINVSYRGGLKHSCSVFSWQTLLVADLECLVYVSLVDLSFSVCDRIMSWEDLTYDKKFMLFGREKRADY